MHVYVCVFYMFVSYRIPENNLSVVPGRAASRQQHLQPSDV